MAEISAPLTRKIYRRQMRFALPFAMTAFILIVEIITARLANSLSLLSDAGHIVTDLFALGLGWFAAVQAERRPDTRHTYGFHRFGILAAFINATSLVLITLYIAFEAVQRLRVPVSVNPPLMLAGASLAILANLLNLRFLGGHHGHGDHSHHTHAHDDLNVRATILHVIGDIGASVAVILGAVAIFFTHQVWIDVLISVLIASALAVSAIRVGREAVSILLESTPAHIRVPDIEGAIRGITGVYGVHHIHVWSISNALPALSCHVIIDDIALSASTPILRAINTTLHDRFHIEHATIQFEKRGLCQHASDCTCGGDAHCGCTADPAQSHHHG